MEISSRFFALRKLKFAACNFVAKLRSPPDLNGNEIHSIFKAFGPITLQQNCHIWDFFLVNSFLTKVELFLQVSRQSIRVVI